MLGYLFPGALLAALFLILFVGVNTAINWRRRPR